MQQYRKIYPRIYQGAMKLGSRLLPWRYPKVLSGPGALNKLAEVIHQTGLTQILIVSDPTIIKLGIVDPLLKDLTGLNIRWTIYGEVQPNPTTDNVEGALLSYKKSNCQGIVAVGGGSSMDCGKICAARLANPQTAILQMKGMFKIKGPLPPIFAVPTTAGTGSENSMGAVITDPVLHSKYTILDTSVIPTYAVLDPQLTVGLPPAVTANTGLDALSHAIEPYIGRNRTREVQKCGENTVRLVFENLLDVYRNGGNLHAREKMLSASYDGGICLRVGAGYVHALAHALGGKYNLPHGYLIGVILPHMLRFYGASAEKRLAELADVSGVIREKNLSQKEKSDCFIQSIFDLNKKLGIPYQFTELHPKDFDEIVQAAYVEACPLYPVPRLMDKKEMKQFLHTLLAPTSVADATQKTVKGSVRL